MFIKCTYQIKRRRHRKDAADQYARRSDGGDESPGRLCVCARARAYLFSGELTVIVVSFESERGGRVAGRPVYGAVTCRRLPSTG